MKKKTLTRFLTLALCMTAFAWNAAAFEPETPETAEEMAVSETAALTDEAQYAAKPAATDAALGTLIYFDNGNSDDLLNEYGFNLGGLSDATTAIDNYYARTFNATNDQMSQWGAYLMIPDSAELNGTLTVVMDTYNEIVKKGFYAISKPACGNLSRAAWGVFADKNWTSLVAEEKCWTKLKYSYVTSEFDGKPQLVGVARSAAASDSASFHVRSIYVYYAPTPVYAAKPAENDSALGELIYFNNGKNIESKANITLKGVTFDNTPCNGYYTGYAVKEDNVSQGPYIVPSSGTVFTDSNGKVLNGKLIFRVELLKESSYPATAAVNFVPVSKTCLPGWKGWSETGTNTYYSTWVQQAAAYDNWGPFTCEADTSANFIGIARVEYGTTQHFKIRSVYVYYKPYEITTSEQTSIRVTDNAGIRFRGSVSEATLASADEAGFIIARGDLLTAGGYNAADEVKISGAVTEKENNPGSFSAKTANGFALAGARNYKKDSIDKLTPDVEGGYDFTGVVINLQKPYTADGVTYANRYAIPLVGRAYVKIGSLYYYGDCTTVSMKDVAEKIKQSGSATYTENQEYIDTVIATAGAKAE